MRGLIQRVAWAEVEIASRVVGRIERGALVYIGVAQGDTAGDARWLAGKVCDLRIFEDSGGKLNLSLRGVSGGVLAIPNFTLLADARKGRRPSFAAAAAPEIAKPLFEAFVSAIHQAGCPVACGVFGEHMSIRSAADGPVNVIIDTLREARRDNNQDRAD
jgi:D-tyrosyl-tRNA(Tyr) deacylase